MPQEKEPRRRGPVFVPYIIVFLIALENEASFISENVMRGGLYFFVVFSLSKPLKQTPS